MTTLNWKIGFELELLAPKGFSRQDLAEAIAEKYQGSVQRFFSLQSEPSKVPGKPVFQNLTHGFEVLDAKGNFIARCVDDLTIQADLDKSCPSLPDWYRIVSDDARLLHLIKRQVNPEDAIADILQPIAELFGTPMTESEGMFRVSDEVGASVAIAVPLPGERERPCELVTAPIETDHFAVLDSLLAIARELGFTIPTEAATHFHFDATRLCSTPIFYNLVNTLWEEGEHLRQKVRTNPHCQRLGKWPEELLFLVNTPGFTALSWDEAVTHLKQLELTKYCDFNIKNFIYRLPNKNTFEARIFPGWLETTPVIEAAKLMEDILWSAVG
ncbi:MULTISPECIES: amidoligase family protein [Cyanophyceae]|uniref:amidoligase family protein n=1 Tax=Cyanophyceae TaxID=3028117 RepID=UPI00081070ED|nr:MULTISPECIES: amidoligase family protein [Cyanophyceae]ANV88580.1 amidoligase enzyme [Picosynechococcus sp. PCC 7117]